MEKKCIICGKKEGDKGKLHGGGEYTVHIYKYKFPYGTIYICGHGCTRHLTLQVNGFASPLVWISLDDLYEEGWKDTLSKEEADNLTAEDFLDIAGTASDILHSDDIWDGDAHRDACDDAVDQWREQKEKEKIEDTPEKELPLLIEDLKYKRNKELLEKRLKGEKNG